MNMQQMYDKVVNHMRAQGNPWGPCISIEKPKTRNWCYINPDNPCERCAKGILMDLLIWENSKTSLGSLSPNNTLNVIEKSLGHELSLNEIKLLNSLECCFEMIHEDKWEYEFEEIATRYNLIYQKLSFKSTKEVENEKVSA